MSEPPMGSMVYWRFKRKEPGRYHFGYVSRAGSMLRMGSWNGDTMGGTIVDPVEIEWKEYSR